MLKTSDCGKRKERPRSKSSPKSSPSKKQKVYNNGVCAGCKAITPFFCKDCFKYSCLNCEIIHREYTSGHGPLVDMHNPTKAKIPCKIHFLECENYCTKCSKPICISCVEHSAHSVLTIMQQSKNKQQTITNKVKKELSLPDEDIPKLEKELDVLERKVAWKKANEENKSKCIKKIIDAIPAKTFICSKNTTLVQDIKKSAIKELNSRVTICFRYGDVAGPIRSCEIQLESACSISDLKKKIKSELGISIVQKHAWEDKWVISKTKANQKLKEGKIVFFSADGSVGQLTLAGKIEELDPFNNKFPFIFESK